MNRRRLMTALAGVLLPGTLAPAFAADALPSAESVLDRYVEVTGGKPAYERRKSEIAHGTLEYPAQGVKGAITRWETDSDNYYATLDIPGIGKIEMGVTDGVAWENSAVMGPRVKKDQEKEQAIREASMNATLNWRKLFPKVELAGSEVVNGEECYKVVMTPATGHAEIMYFQKKSGLAVKTTTVASSPMGEIPVEVLVSDYKNFGGVLMVWDKLFGTYRAESEKPVYGITTGFVSHNPFILVFNGFLELIRGKMKSKG